MVDFVEVAIGVCVGGVMVKYSEKICNFLNYYIGSKMNYFYDAKSMKIVGYVIIVSSLLFFL